MTKRACGQCRACCTVLQVDALKKAVHEPCKHLATPPEKGCTIYAERPQACREWRCAWLLGWTPVEDRPDRFGVVLDMKAPGRDPGHAVHDMAKTRVWVAYPAPGHAILSPYARGFLAKLAEMAIVQWMGAHEGRALGAEYAGPQALLTRVADEGAALGFRIKLRTFR